MVEYYEARVLFDYTPATCDELRLHEGEPVEVRIDRNHPDSAEEGWLSGTDLRGHHGMFPSNYVEDVRTAAAVDAHQSPRHDSHAACVNNTATLDEKNREQEGIMGSVNLGQQQYVGATRKFETLPAISLTLTRPAADVTTVGVEDHSAALGSRDTNNTGDNPLGLPGRESLETVHRASDHVLDTAVLPKGSHQPGSGDTLPVGWFSAADEAGVVYYYTEDGQCSWTRPAAIMETTTALGSGGEQTAQMVMNEDRQAREHAAIRIQAISRGKHARRNNVARQPPQDEQSLPATQRGEKSTTHEERPGAIGQECPDVDRECWGGGGAVAGGRGEGAAASGGSPVTEASEGSKTDKQITQLIASLVDERLTEKLHQRDAILSDIQATVSTLASQREVIAGLSSVTATTRPLQEGESHESPPRLRRVAPQSSELASAPTTPGRRSNKGANIANAGARARTLNPLNDPNARGALRNSPSRASPRRAGGSPRHSNEQESGRSSRPSGRSIGVSLPDERSESPPSRSQPLRALAHSDVDSSMSPAYWAPDDDGYGTPRFGAGGDVAPHEKSRGARGGRGGAGADVAGVPPQTMPPLPRVADLEGAHRLTLAKQREKEAEAAALVRPAAAAAHHRGGRTSATALYHPSWYDPARADTSLPESELALEYIHGYAGETPGRAGPGGGAAGGGGGGGGFGGSSEQVKGRVGGARQAATRSTNIMWLRTGEVVFPASAVVVIHDFETNQQRFFTGHDEEVTALAVHPFHDIVVSGQAGKEAIVCLFDATRRPEVVARRDPKARPAAGSASFEAGGETADEATRTTTFLRELSLGKKEKRGVAALDFSSDGNLILAMAGGDGQALSVWDWRRGVRLATARAEAAFLPAHSVRFNPWLFLEGTRAEAAGMSPGDACYTLVSCGQRHVRFWTLTRERLPYPSSGGEGGGGEGRRGWVWTLSSRRGSFDKRGEIENMTCMAFIGEPLAGGRRRGDDMVRLPVARVVTGADTGQIYFWEVAEEGRVAPTNSGAGGGGGHRVGWKPHGRLLAVVPKAHDGALTDMCYLPHGEDRVPAGKRRADGASVARVCSKREDWGRLATCGGEGTLRLWGVTGEGSSPLQLLLTVEVSNRGVGIGHARSVSWDRSGTTLALGTVGNAVCLVQPGEDIDGTRTGTGNRSEGQDGTGSVMFMLAVQGHTGTCKALAPHPTRPWFVTGGTDRVLRLWDAHSRRQLSAARLLERVSSAAFHPAGDVLAVGNEAGDFFLMALRAPSSLTATGPQPPEPLPATTTSAGRGDAVNPSAGFAWDVLARKHIPLGAGAAVQAATSTGASRSAAARPEHPSPGSRTSHHKDEVFRRGGEGNVVGGSLSLSAARHLGDSGRRKPKPTPAAGGGGAGSSAHAGRNHSSSTGRPRDGGGEPSSRSPSKMSVGAEALAAVGGAGSAAIPTITTAMDVACLRFSPGGDVLAAACGNSIHLYREEEGGAAGGPSAVAKDNVTGGGAGGRVGVGRDGGGGGGSGVYRRYGVCTGHGTMVKCFDFSRDGSAIQSNDASGELLFWEVVTGRQITNGFSVRDLEMDTWSCPVGWPSQGLKTVANGGVSNVGSSHSTGGVVAVCRSNAGDVLAMSDEDNCVSLMRNPAPAGVKARANWGHTAASRVSGLAFLCDDRRLVSAGGTCAFVWRQVRRPTSHHRQDEGAAAARTAATTAEEYYQ